MENYSDGVFTEKSSFLIDGGDRFGVSAVSWDFQEELLWVGNQGGHVTSYYGASFHKYTSFQVHDSDDVRQLLTFDAGLLIVTPTALRCQQRRGIPIFTHSSELFEDLQCLVQNTGTTILLGGHQPHLIEFDLMSAKEIRKIDIGEKGCAILRQHPRFVCSGDATGCVSLRDPRTLREEHKFVAHTESLSDFDVHNNLVVTCGYSSRQGGIVPDRFLKVYDVRMLRALSPVPVVGEPFLLRFLPAFSSQLAVVSAMGQLQILDANAPASSALQLFQVNTQGAMCMALEVSSSCQCVAVGDSGGYLHTFGSNSSVIFNSFSRGSEFADPIEPLLSIPMDDFTTPLTSIPSPYPSENSSLSDWPDQFSRRRYRRVPPVDPLILNNMRMVGTIGYAPNPADRRPNQVSYSTEKRVQRGSKHSTSDQSHLKENGEGNKLWKRYHHIEMRYTKGAMDENELARYNSTPLCGLDNTLPNSYANSLLQVFYYIPEVRQLLLEHTCNREFCLACELSFLFHMLDVGRSQGLNGHPATIQPANFLRAFRTLPEASAMGLLLPESHPEIKRKSTLPRLAQSWARFILQQLSSETTPVKCALEPASSAPTPTLTSMSKEDPEADSGSPVEEKETPSEDMATEDNASHVSKLFGVDQEQTSRCTKCSNENSKVSVVLLSSLMLQDLDGEHSFEEVLERSFDVSSVTPAWCETCQKYQATQQRRRCLSLPPLLALSCANDTLPGFTFWSTQLQTLLGPEAYEGSGEGSVMAGAKPCRYGLECTRPNCKFWHGSKPVSHGSDFTGISSKHWVPSELGFRIRPEGGVICDKADNISEDSQRYSLIAAVCWIDEPRIDSKHPDKRHLVSAIQVPSGYFSTETMEDGTNEKQWYLFNDFSVSHISGEESISFFPDWKLPCLLFYSRLENDRTFMDRPLNPITADVFKEDKSLALKSEVLQRISFLPLAADEMPGRGDLVAMDAEFVTLNQEEAELRSDGKSTTVRPPQMSVARVTVIRGLRNNGLSWTSADYLRQGSMEGLPFIDDYIATQDQVVDYLTKFSGIQPGDLDVASSSKHLTTLKSTYLKLRFLIDNGVTFVGHGLQNDFRVINLVVPANQVIDTVHLFHLPHQRMISLRFLAWHFLGLKIQSVTHDSVEDAQTAIRLYRRYQELKAKGDDFFNESLQELYAVGRRLQWTVPGMDDEE